MLPLSVRLTSSPTAKARFPEGEEAAPPGRGRSAKGMRGNAARRTTIWWSTGSGLLWIPRKRREEKEEEEKESPPEAGYETKKAAVIVRLFAFFWSLSIHIYTHKRRIYFIQRFLGLL